MSDFFTMTRHERRGTIVLIVVIAALIAGLAASRSCHRGDTPSPETQQAIEQFEHHTDSLRTRQQEARQRKTTRNEKKDADKQKRQRKSKKGKKPAKSEPQPRRLDPVPQF